MRAINFSTSSINITGNDSFNTAAHSSTVRGVIWKTACTHEHIGYSLNTAEFNVVVVVATCYYYIRPTYYHHHYYYYYYYIILIFNK